MNTLYSNEMKNEIGLKLRVIAALWFVVAASIPGMFFLLTYKGGDFILIGSVAWFFLELPILAAALSGFMFGAVVLDPWVIDTPGQAARIGLKVSFISYLIFVFGTSALSGLWSAEDSIIWELLGIIAGFFYLGVIGLIFVGWLIAILGWLAGWTLFHISRLDYFESELFHAERIDKNTLQKTVVAAVILFLACSVPATIKIRNGNHAREMKLEEYKNKR